MFGIGTTNDPVSNPVRKLPASAEPSQEFINRIAAFAG
jgi:hypothetical protein